MHTVVEALTLTHPDPRGDYFPPSERYVNSTNWSGLTKVPPTLASNSAVGLEALMASSDLPARIAALTRSRIVAIMSR